MFRVNPIFVVGNLHLMFSRFDPNRVKGEEWRHERIHSGNAYLLAEKPKESFTPYRKALDRRLLEGLNDLTIRALEEVDPLYEHYYSRELPDGGTVKLYIAGRSSFMRHGGGKTLIRHKLIIIPASTSIAYPEIVECVRTVLGDGILEEVTVKKINFRILASASWDYLMELMYLPKLKLSNARLISSKGFRIGNKRRDKVLTVIDGREYSEKGSVIEMACNIHRRDKQPRLVDLPYIDLEETFLTPIRFVKKNRLPSSIEGVSKKGLRMHDVIRKARRNDTLSDYMLKKAIDPHRAREFSRVVEKSYRAWLRGEPN